MTIRYAIEIKDMTLDIFDDRFNWYRAGRMMAMSSGEKDALVGERMTVNETRASRTYLFDYPKQGRLLGDLRIDQVTPTRIKAHVTAAPWAAAHWAPPLIAWLDGLAAAAAPEPLVAAPELAPAPSAAAGDQVTEVERDDKPQLTPAQQKWLFIIRQAEYEWSNFAVENTQFCIINGLNHDTFRKRKTWFKQNSVKVDAWKNGRPAGVSERVIAAIKEKRDEGWAGEPEIHL